MYSLVCAQFSTCPERFLTDGALERFDALVDVSNMRIHYVQTSEGVSAMATLVRLLSTMRPFVLFQVINLGKSFSTLLAVKRLLSGMATFMRSETARFSEAFSAMGTPVKLLLSVSALVYAHCRICCKTFRAESAFKRFHALMNDTVFCLVKGTVCNSLDRSRKEQR